MPRGKKAEPVNVAEVATTTPTGSGTTPNQDASATAIATCTALDNTGSLVVDTIGDGGERELEVSAAQERFDGLHVGLDVERSGMGSVVAEGVAFIIDLFKHRPKAWDQLSQTEQRDLISGIEDNVHELVEQVVTAVRAADEDSVRCLFVGFTDKGDDIKAELKVKAISKEDTEKAVVAMHRARGKLVMVTVVSADDFHTEPARDTSEADQPGLTFEAGSDEHPTDDHDLEAAAIPEGGKPALPMDTTEIVETGDSIVHDRMGICEARINLKSGMVELLVGGAIDRNLDASWIDLREASPAELAMERDRVADFGANDQEDETREEAVEA